MACAASVCTLSVDESQNAIWTSSASGPWLTLWSDGTLLVQASGEASTVDANGNATAFLGPPFPLQRATIYIPASEPDGGLAGLPDGGSEIEQVLLNYSGYVAYTEQAATVWANGIDGCCGFSEAPSCVDPTVGQSFGGKAMTVFDLNHDGATPVVNDYHAGGYHYASPSYIYVDAFGGEVDQYDRSNLSGNPARSFYVVPDAGAPSGSPVQRAALTATEDLITLHPELGLLSRFQHNGVTAWQIPWSVNTPPAPITPQQPILNAAGDVVIGGTVGGNPSLCTLDATTGATKWCTTTPDDVLYVLAGDDGVLYTAINGQSSVRGYDATTGVLRSTFTGVPTPVELLLRDGVLYAWGEIGGTALAVPAQHYAASSWPVYYHDNQRTASTLGSLAY